MPVLLSKTIDPLLGVITGFLALYLREQNPRTAPPEGESLYDLVRWKWEKSQREQERQVSLTSTGEKAVDSGISK